jgi:hypothetical protein
VHHEGVRNVRQGVRKRQPHRLDQNVVVLDGRVVPERRTPPLSCTQYAKTRRPSVLFLSSHEQLFFRTRKSTILLCSFEVRLLNDHRSGNRQTRQHVTSSRQTRLSGRDLDILPGDWSYLKPKTQDLEYRQQVRQPRLV